MNIFFKFFALLRLREAIRKADTAFIRTRSRHYVLPGPGRSLIILNRKNFRILKQKGYIPRIASLEDARREAFYFTPFPNGDGRISQEIIRIKRNQFLDWFRKR